MSGCGRFAGKLVIAQKRLTISGAKKQLAELLLWVAQLRVAVRQRTTRERAIVPAVFLCHSASISNRIRA
jgi:hypothetical protein